VDVEQMFEQRLGVKFGTVLKSIGNRLHYFASGAPTQDNPLGDLSLVLELADDSVWKTLIEKAVEVTGGALQPKKYMGRDIYSQGASTDDADAIDPAFCVTDRNLIVSLRSKSVEKVVRRIGKDVPGIGDKPAYKALVAKLPSQVTSISFSSKEYTDASMAMVRDTIENGMLPIDDLPEGLFEFLTALGRTMDDSVSFGIWNDNGYYGESVAPYRK